MTTRRQVLGMGAAAAALSATSAADAFSATSAPAGYTATIRPAHTFGTWQGWGASLSWWANVFGGQSKLADIFFTTETVPFQGRTLPGLGLNVVRYHLGAHMSQPAWPGGPREAVSPNEKAYKQIQGYWVNWLSDNPAHAGSWNWQGDSEQRHMLRMARDRGANVYQTFSCSPIWWMCKNHNPSGAADGGDNLQSWNYRQHARYLAIVAKYAKDHWGVDFDSVEPFNEPSGSWWKADGRQEDCHIGAERSRPIQQQVIHYLRQELDARGLQHVTVAASDENSYTQANTTWSNLTALGAQRWVGQVDTHGYEYHDAGSARSALYQHVHADGKRLWQSEYGEEHEHGLYLAYNLALDLRFLHPAAWCYWQPVDSQVTDPTTGRHLSWGLLKATYSASRTHKGGVLGDARPHPGTDRYVTNKYFVLAQYTRHVRPGMWIVDSGDQATVAAYDPRKYRLVLVTVRGDTPQKITYDLSRFRTVGSTARRWVTDADPHHRISRQYRPAPALHLQSKRLTLLVSAYSVQTLEIDNVHI